MFYNEPQDISPELWVELIQDKKVTRDSDVKLLKVVYEAPNHEIRALDIAKELNLPHHGPLNLQIGRFGKRVVAQTGMEPSLRSDGGPRWWHIFFLGYETRDKGFPWIMRPELVIAFEQLFPIANNAELVSTEQTNLQDQYSLPDGAVSQVLVNRYERNRRARSICIAHHGSKCVICGFDFEAVYGPIGQNKIHVHHLKPLSQIQAQYEVDPVRDLCPVCPNCHLIIHSKQVPFTIEEVKAIMARRSDV